MPTYDYRCKSCGHEFELFQSMRDKPIRKCPECSRNTAERLIGVGAGIIFKGSGFYETDYRSESYKKSAEAEKKATSGDSKDGKEKKNGKAEKSGKSDATPCAKGAACGCAPKKPAKNES
ncbi:MAG: zinc ribbon domain-containing protein [Phycisphaeraceae bacterium]|nr:MAG: zinc ribbon domain-containing protein [Phycisphaeraceae bacterium]